MKMWISKIKENIDDLYWSFRLKWIDRHDRLKIKTLNQGDYYDRDEIFLHSCFSILTDFVDEELATRYRMDCKDYKESDAGYLFLKDMKRQWINLSRKQHENPSKFTDSETFELAYLSDYMEILDLYEWWTMKRPARKDPCDVSGFTKEYEKLMEKYEIEELLNWEIVDEESDKRIKECSRKSNEIETKYRNQDQKMLHRLVDIRCSLWT